MQFWPKSGSCCCEDGCGVITGVVYSCCTSFPLEGATVVLKQSGVTISTTTSASDGTYSVPFFVSSGGLTAAVTVSYSGYTTQIVNVNTTGAGTGALVCGHDGTKNVTLIADNVTRTCTCACNPDSACETVATLPTVFYLSDGVDTVTLTYDVSRGSWMGCATRSIGTQTFGSRDVTGERNCTGATTASVILWWELTCTILGTFACKVYHEDCTVAGPRRYAVAFGSCASFVLTNHFTGLATATATSCDPFAVTFPGLTISNPNTPEADLWGLGTLNVSVSE